MDDDDELEEEGVEVPVFLKIPGIKITHHVETARHMTYFIGTIEGSDKEVFIEVVRLAACVDPQESGHFISRGATLKGLVHPLIPRYICHGESKGSAYLVYECPSNAQRLSDILERKKKFTLLEALDVLTQIANVLSYLHRIDQVHGQIRPSNIFCLASNEILLRNATAFYESHHFIEQMIKRRPAYVSPEQIGFQETDKSSDIYSFGILIFELCKGRVPYTGKKASKVHQKHLDQPVPSLGKVQVSLPGIQKLIKRCLNKNPDKRATIDEVYSELCLYRRDIKGIAPRKLQDGQMKGSSKGVRAVPIEEVIRDQKANISTEGNPSFLSSRSPVFSDSLTISSKTSDRMKGKTSDRMKGKMAFAKGKKGRKSDASSSKQHGRNSRVQKPLNKSPWVIAAVFFSILILIFAYPVDSVQEAFDLPKVLENIQTAEIENPEGEPLDPLASLAEDSPTVVPAVAPMEAPQKVAEVSLSKTPSVLEVKEPAVSSIPSTGAAKNEDEIDEKIKRHIDALAAKGGASNKAEIRKYLASTHSATRLYAYESLMAGSYRKSLKSDTDTEPWKMTQESSPEDEDTLEVAMKTALGSDGNYDELYLLASNGPNLGVRRSSVHALTRSRYEMAIPVILEFIHEHGRIEEVNFVADQFKGKLPPYLKSMLRKRQSKTTRMALLMVQRIPGEESLEILKSIFDEEVQFRLHAALALANKGEDEVLLLMDRLAHGKPGAQRAAWLGIENSSYSELEVLIRMERGRWPEEYDRKATLLLLTLESSASLPKNLTESEARVILARLDERPPEEAPLFLADLFGAFNLEFDEYLLSFYKNFDKNLHGVLEKAFEEVQNETFRFKVIAFMGDVVSKKNIPFLMNKLQDTKYGSAAMESIRPFGDEVLESVNLSEQKNIETAMQLLEVIDSKRADLEVLRLIEKNQGAQAKKIISRFLLSPYTKNERAQLILQTVKRENLVKFCIQEMGKVDRAFYRTSLVSQLRHENRAIREMAFSTLTKSPSFKPEDLLIYFQRSTHRDLQDSILRRLTLENPKRLEILELALGGKEPKVKAVALQKLIQTPSNRTEELLLSSFAGEQDPKVKQLISAYYFKKVRKTDFEFFVLRLLSTDSKTSRKAAGELKNKQTSIQLRVLLQVIKGKIPKNSRKAIAEHLIKNGQQNQLCASLLSLIPGDDAEELNFLVSTFLKHKKVSIPLLEKNLNQASRFFGTSQILNKMKVSFKKEAASGRYIVRK